MKHFLKFLSLVAIVASFSPLAKADSTNQISFSGSVTYNAGGVSGATTFNPPLTSSAPGYGNAQVSGTSTGIFSAFIAYNPLLSLAQNTYVNFMNFNMNSTSTFELFTATAPNGNILNFYVTSQSVTTNANGVEDAGTGYYTLNGVTILNGTFDMTTQGASGTNVSFSDTNSVTPEPNSLMLLGTGLVGAAGMLIRRRRSVGSQSPVAA